MSELYKPYTYNYFSLNKFCYINKFLFLNLNSLDSTYKGVFNYSWPLNVSLYTIFVIPVKITITGYGRMLVRNKH